MRESCGGDGGGFIRKLSGERGKDREKLIVVIECRRPIGTGKVPMGCFVG